MHLKFFYCNIGFKNSYIVSFFNKKKNVLRQNFFFLFKCALFISYFFNFKIILLIFLLLFTRTFERYACMHRGFSCENKYAFLFFFQLNRNIERCVLKFKHNNITTSLFIEIKLLVRNGLHVSHKNIFVINF